MVRRDPVETGGEYYRIVSEGRIKAYDGFNLPVARVKTGLDLNRNFPEEWRPESEQLGAGDFPTSEPEVRACVEFVNKHRNICGGVFFHTWSGVLLRSRRRQTCSRLGASNVVMLGAGAVRL